ncbi:MAG: PBP1A family penicillin-binding protein [Myxococcota bacterium]
MAFNPLRGLRILLVSAGALALASALGSVAFHLLFLRDLPDLKSVDDYRPALASHVYDRNGLMIGEFFSERRRLTPLSSLPAHVVDAFVASEDNSFFEHTGIDYMSILRAAWVNLRAGGEIIQGGSTITQQMVKSLLLSPERKYRRKIREMILARRIEVRFSKQEILHLYLNQIYFGHGAYGIGEAANTYFGKPVEELTVSEGALLAGLPKAPSRFSPFANPKRAELRRRYVLGRMLATERIDPETYEWTIADLPVLRAETSNEAIEASAYFTEEVRRLLFDELGGDKTLRGGLSIETTLDLPLQIAAVEAVKKGLKDLDRRQGYRGHIRRVPVSQIPAEIDLLAEKNGLALPVDDELEDDTAAPEVKDEAAESASGSVTEPGVLSETDIHFFNDVGLSYTLEARSNFAGWSPPEIPEGTSLLGVVTEVDIEKQVAWVSFAPGVQGAVALKDVDWARAPDRHARPRPVTSIGAIFSEGDVARFRRLPPPEERKSADESGGIDWDETMAFDLEQEPIVQGALLSLDVTSGDVLALVGGADFRKSQFNRVTQAQRQPGSAFKPLIYGAALARSYSGASILYDRPVVYVDETSGFIWRPRNYGRSFYGPITLRESLVRSVNNATVHLFRDVGVDFVLEYARHLGITSPLNRDLSLALGSSGVSLLELTRAYAVYPSGGRRVTPVYIRRVMDQEGRVLLENVALRNVSDEVEHGDAKLFGVDVAALDDETSEEEVDPDQLIPPEQAYLATSLMRAVVTDPHGTGWRLRALKRPLAGKTGTTNEQGDAWLMGFSPTVMTGVWVGHDEKHFLGWGETGSRAAAPIWVDYMRVALADRPIRDFSVPEPIVFARIDRKTGLLAASGSTDTVFQAFVSGTEPTETDTTARTTSEGRRLLRLDAF